jgi:lon-related putative ATP-dependent protease
MMPIVDGKVIKEEEFDKLDDEIKQEYEDTSLTIVQEQIIDVINQIKELGLANLKRKVSEWQSSTALFTIEGHLNYVKSQFKRNKKINQFLDGVKKDIIKNISKFVEVKPKKTTNNVNEDMNDIKPWDNYRVNVFVDNSKTDGAPVIMDSNYSFTNLFGRLEYENYYGMLKTDFTMLRAGLIQKANGGYIMFQANDLLSNPASYDYLKKILRSNEIGIDNNVDQKTSMTLVSLKPEPIPLNIKVILIGNEDVYQTLLSVDETFKKLFKIKVEFENYAPLDERNLNDFAGFIHSFCTETDLPHLDKYAVAKLAEYDSRLAEDQQKLSTKFGELSNIIVEAGTWARISGEKIVNAECIEKTLAERKRRMIKYDEQYSEMINNGTLLIDTQGFKVGQINGLTIMTVGEYSFGKPARITANTYIGKKGVINIEREVELSGSSHSKGILILNGYLGEKFAKDMPLSLTASICFEQLYGGIDGDSASSTELYALLSSLSGVPINQSIAVTGSVNQKGEIQAIGGVNEKIEGFYDVCKERGLTGEQGVLIPKENIRNLNLKDEVVEDVKHKKFHIYTASTIDEGIEVLTGVPAGDKDAPGTINYLVYQTLKKFAAKAN